MICKCFYEVIRFKSDPSIVELLQALLELPGYSLAQSQQLSSATSSMQSMLSSYQIMFPRLRNLWAILLRT